jgi:hypothetical protein
MASHSRALADILLKNAPKKGVKTVDVKKKEPVKPTGKK